MSAPAGGGNLAPEDPPPLLRRPRIRLLLVVVGVAMLLVAGAGGLFLERQRAYDQNIQRIPGAFPAEPARPARVPGRAQNWLLVGSDRRADQGTTGQDAEEPLWRYGAQRADTIMLVHLPADRKRIYLVSFPRDAWTPIQGHGNAKLNAAFSFGGPPLLIATMERLTGVRVDHFAILDFEGFRSMTDALGGVTVRVARTVRDPARKVVWPAGSHHLDGARALDFVRQRRNLPGGDLGRIRRQHPLPTALAGQEVGQGAALDQLHAHSAPGGATGGGGGARAPGPSRPLPPRPPPARGGGGGGGPGARPAGRPGGGAGRRPPPPAPRPGAGAGAGPPGRRRPWRRRRPPRPRRRRARRAPAGAGGGGGGRAGGAVAGVDQLHVGQGVVGVDGQRGAVAEVSPERLQLVGVGRAGAEVLDPPAARGW